MGKRIGKDADQGKLTYPAVLGEEQSEARAHEMAEAAIAALQPFGEIGSTARIARPIRR